MNGKCQITSPMPGFTWMTAQPAALEITLITAPKVAICAL